MSLKISEFAKALTNGGARSSMFDVELTGYITERASGEGTDAKAAIKETMADINFACRATTFPGMTVTPIVTTYFGREIKMPGELEFADWSVTIMNDNNMRVRRFMEKWSHLINHHGDNIIDSDTYISTTGGGWPFAGEATIQQYNKTGVATQKYTMKEIWPASIDPIDMSYDNIGTIQEFGVTFSVNYWEHTTESDGKTVAT